MSTKSTFTSSTKSRRSRSKTDTPQPFPKSSIWRYAVITLSPVFFSKYTPNILLYLTFKSSQKGLIQPVCYSIQYPPFKRQERQNKRQKWQKVFSHNHNPLYHAEGAFSPRARNVLSISTISARARATKSAAVTVSMLSGVSTVNRSPPTGVIMAFTISAHL